MLADIHTWQSNSAWWLLAGNRSSTSPVSGRYKRLELQISTGLKLCIMEVDKFPSAAKMWSFGGPREE